MENDEKVMRVIKHEYSVNFLTACVIIMSSLCLRDIIIELINRKKEVKHD